MFDRFLKGTCVGMIFVLAGAAVIQAAYLRNIPVHVKQPDGTTLSCLASGDEFYNWLHDKDDYTIVRNPATGFLVYADKVEGRLVPTEFVAGRTAPLLLEQAGIKPRLLDDPKVKGARIAAAEGEPVVNAPKTGTINNLVVYIRFSDQEEFAEAFIDSAELALNSTTAGVNSFRNYFAEASYSQLTVSSTCYPASTPGVFSYQDANPRAYYMPYDATTNPTGYNGDTERRTREHTLLQSAVNAISAEVPPALIIDADLDGRVDNICFVVRGEPTAWSSLLWPHKWDLYTYSVYIQGKRVYTYNLQLETSVDVGVLCHEMFHSLGAPDLYHYNADYSYLQPAWAWDLMQFNLDPPQHMGAYMKWKYGTWISSIPQITASGTYTLHPVTSSTNNCYRIASPASTTEYFVVEYRKRTGGGTFESSLLNEGLLVYRINTAYTGNASGPPDEVYIYRPDGTPTANGQPLNAPLSSNQGRTQINDGTNPSSFLTGGTPGGLSISNVGSLGDTISFDVTLNTLTVTSPNGGENWVAGNSATVTWTSTGSMSVVDIGLTTDGGANWTTLANDTLNDGSETITVPLVTGTLCFIAVVEGNYGVPADYSNASFSIIMPPASVTVTSPNGGEVWAAGSSHDVTWTQTGLTGSVTIDLYKGGVMQKTLGTAGASGGIFSWAIGAGETAGTDYRIRVWQGSVWDESDADFALVLPASLPFDEDFTVLPPDWLQQNTGTGIGSQWGYSDSNHAGGSSYEVICSWALVDPGTTRLITPPIDTTGATALRLSFKHSLDAYGTGCTLKIQTSPDLVTWTDEAWSVATTATDLGPGTVVTDLTHNLNIATTYVAFVITGNLYQFDFWYIDDVSITGAASPRADFNGDGQEDVLWRYYGAGGYNYVWYLGNSGGQPMPLARVDSVSAAAYTGIRLAGKKAPAKTPMNTRNRRPDSDRLKRLQPKGPLAPSVADPRQAGGGSPSLSPLALADPRNAGLPLAAPITLGGADILPVDDPSWEIAGVADFDGDTRVDILWRHNGPGGENVIWLMDGTDGIGNAMLPPVADLDWRIVGTGDFNNDTHLDILWRYNGGAGTNLIWYMNGTEVAGSAELVGVSDLDWQIAGTGDFNKDGHVDILWRYNGTDGYNVVWHLNDTAIIGSADLTPVADLNWQIAGTGDYDKDGNTDILWRYYGPGGHNYIWYMDGVTPIGGGTLVPVEDVDWRIVNR